MASFGERLRREREKQKLSLDDVSNITKISTRSLRALEEEKFDQLPGGIFNKGFVRAYAKQLGMDERQVVEDYLEASGEVSPSTVAEGEQPGLASLPSSDSQTPWGMLAVLLLLVALGIAGWGYYTRRNQQRNASATTPQPTAQPSPSPVKTVGEVAPAVQHVPDHPVASGSQTQTVNGFDLLLKASQEVWISITKDDQPATEVTLREGQSSTIHARQRVVLKIGNAAGLDVFFNGTRVPAFGGQDETRTLIFGEAGLQPPTSASPKNP